MVEMSFLSVANIIFIITIVISLVASKNRSLLYKLMFSPYAIIHNRKWYLFITSGFIHSDVMHLLFNMVTFYFFAFDLEKTIGSTNFLIIYLSSLIFSHLPTFIKQKNNYNYHSLGASGAISGILFSSILIYPTNKIMMFPIPIPLPSFIFGIFYLVWCKFAEKNVNDNINHSAHFTGAIVGIITSFILFGEQILIILKNTIS